MLVPERAAARRARTQGPGNGRIHATSHSTDDRLVEAVGLAQAISLDVAAAQIVSLAAPRPATLFGTGKVTELAESEFARKTREKRQKN